MENKVYTSHAKKEMIEEEFGTIKEQEVFEAIINGEIIENYDDAKPYPSKLIYGKSIQSKPNVVCAYSEEDNMSIIVTVYQPNPDIWYEYRRRKK